MSNFSSRSEDWLCKENSKNTAAGSQRKTGIGVDIGSLLFVIPVEGGDHIHNAAGDGYVHLGILRHEFKEVILQGGFIFPVVRKICGKGIVMGVGESIGSVMDQLAQGIVIKEIPAALLFQTPGNMPHKAPGIAVIMAAQPLAAKGPL